jgi:hypothetical protein
MVAVIERCAGHSTRGIEQIGGHRDAAKPLLDRFEFCDRDMELLADARLRAGHVSGGRTGLTPTDYQLSGVHLTGDEGPPSHWM